MLAGLPAAQRSAARAAGTATPDEVAAAVLLAVGQLGSRAGGAETEAESMTLLGALGFGGEEAGSAAPSIQNILHVYRALRQGAVVGALRRARQCPL